MKSKQERQAQIRECLRKRKQRLKDQNLCQDCGKIAPESAKTLCRECLEARRERAIKK